MPLPPMLSFFHKPLMLSLEVPDGWARTRHPGPTLEIFGPEVKDYRTNILFDVHPMTSDAPDSFDQLVQASYFGGNMESELDQYSLVESDLFVLDGCRAFQARFHWVGHNDAGANLPLTQLDVLLLVAPATVYEIHAFALRELEDTELPLLEYILGSIRLLPPKPPAEKEPYHFEISPN